MENLIDASTLLSSWSLGVSASAGVEIQGSPSSRGMRSFWDTVGLKGSGSSEFRVWEPQDSIGCRRQRRLLT